MSLYIKLRKAENEEWVAYKDRQWRQFKETISFNAMMDGLTPDIDDWGKLFSEKATEWTKFASGFFEVTLVRPVLAVLYAAKFIVGQALRGIGDFFGGLKDVFLSVKNAQASNNPKDKEMGVPLRSLLNIGLGLGRMLQGVLRSATVALLTIGAPIVGPAAALASVFTYTSFVIGETIYGKYLDKNQPATSSPKPQQESITQSINNNPTKSVVTQQTVYLFNRMFSE